MKILLCINRTDDFNRLFEAIAARADQPLILPDPQSSHFIFGFHYLQHEIDVCVTGFGLFQTSFKITKALAQKRYHLALKASLCNAYKAEIQIGDIVNVIKDKPGDSESFIISATTAEDQTGKWADLYESGMINVDDFPHFKGAFINMNNSYMNVMMPFKKVVAVTVNQYGDRHRHKDKIDKYKADIETRDGLGFVYACMYERQPFYQLNAVECNLSTGDHDSAKAIYQLNETLLDVLQKL